MAPAVVFHNRPGRRIYIPRENKFGGVLLCEREHRGARLPAGALHHREQSDGARRGPEVRHQQIYGTYGQYKIERFIWSIS